MRTIIHIAIREWKRIVSLPEYYLVLLVLPPAISFLYGFMYDKQMASDQPVAIWDEARSPLSRQFTFLLEETESIHITTQVDNEVTLQKLIQQGKIQAAVHFPKDMDAHIKSRQPVYITLYTNAASMVTAKLIYRDAAKVLITAGSGVILQKLVKTGMPSGKAMALVQPIKLDTYILYNPQYNYQKYLVPGLIAVGLQMMIIMATILALNLEIKKGTFYELQELAGNSASNILLGKGLAYLSVGWLHYILATCIVYPFFAQGHIGGSFALFILFSVLIMACISIGMMVSAILNDVMVACDVGLFYTSPTFVFSGFTFPRWAMPWYDQYYAWLMPFTPFIEGFYKTYFMELPLHYAYRELAQLLLYIVVTFPIALFFLQHKLNKPRLQHA
ncbi:ABC transporter permease [Chitinophaga arvensicola]|uniref:ABC-2 type transport system permease protein n=1 Tax=Chitinophaga arvensicola TaxID=29529 RepID=A0A1I0S670_9BACT|nr:ABC transporter permease [Chitinophaga arvensicola]SEW50919.1 ABC-2 type transport system permease protein [Chitinophaga arvensicola]